MITVALDPGIEFAIAWGFHGKLGNAAFRPDKMRDFAQGGRLVVEFPKYYLGGKATPATVAELAFSAGVQCGNLGADQTTPVARVPTVALPKDEIERRVRKVLTADELVILDAAMARTPKTYRNNVVDAVRHFLVFERRMLP